MSFLDLSQEVVVHVFSYLPYTSLDACRRVNHAFNRLIHDSILLRYSMQLQLSGYEDNPYSPLVIAEKLKSLKEQEDAWCRLDLDEPVSVGIPFTPSSIYDLTDGILLLGELSSGLPTGADFVRWARVSDIAAAQEAQDLWEKIDVGAHIIDVGLAAHEHDLIVVATDRETEDHQTIYELRLIQLSTGLSHPLASKPVIPLATVPWSPQVIVGQCSVCIEVIGDLLCFLFHYPPFARNPPAMLEVYDWKSGKCLQVRQLSCPTYATFTFIASDIIALPNCDENHIELCRIGDTSEGLDEPSSVETICVLALPPLQTGTAIAQLTCRSEPKMTKSSVRAAAFRSSEPFHLKPENAVVIFNIMMHDTQGVHECFTLIVHCSALLSALAARPPKVSPSLWNALGETPKGEDKQFNCPLVCTPVIPWPEWGPRVCRWLETSFNASRWVTTTCGQRFVTVEEDSEDEDPLRTTIMVYDFNPHTVWRLASKHRRKRRRLRGTYWDISLPEGEVVAASAFTPFFTKGDGQTLIPFSDPDTRVIGQIQCEPTELPVGHPLGLGNTMFKEQVRSSLPFAQLSSYETFHYGAVLLDRNTLIGVKLNDMDDINELVFHPLKTRH